MGVKYSTVKRLKATLREMENISRGPTFGEFVPILSILTERPMQDVKVARLQSARVQIPLSPPLLIVMYCMRVSLRTVKIFLAQY